MVQVIGFLIICAAAQALTGLHIFGLTAGAKHKYRNVAVPRFLFDLSQNRNTILERHVDVEYDEIRQIGPGILQPAQKLHTIENLLDPETIVIGGVQKLRPGQKVSVKQGSGA